MNLTLRYDLHPSDLALAAAAIHHGGTDAGTRFRQQDDIAFVLTLVSLVLLAGSAWIPGIRSRILTDAVAWGLGALVVTACAAIAIRRQNRLRSICRAIGRRGDLLGPRTLIVSPSGLTLRRSADEATLGWQAFARHVDGTGVLVILQYDRDVFEVIPKLAFESPADLDAFEELLFRNRAPASRAFPVLPPPTRSGPGAGAAGGGQ